MWGEGERSLHQADLGPLAGALDQVDRVAAVSLVSVAFAAGEDFAVIGPKAPTPIAQWCAKKGVFDAAAAEASAFNGSR